MSPPRKGGSGELLRRSKRNKFHLDVVAILHMRTDPKRPVEESIKKDRRMKETSTDGGSQNKKTPSPKRSSSVTTRPPPSFVRQTPEVKVNGGERKDDSKDWSVEMSRGLVSPSSDQSSKRGSPVLQKKESDDESELGDEAENGDLQEKQKKPDKSSTGMAEVVGKRERKTPARHRDFISDDEMGMKRTHGRPEKLGEQSAVQEISEEEYQCPKCPAHFDSRRGLTNHVKQHGMIKRFSCDLCDFSCEYAKTMRIHQRAHEESNEIAERVDQSSNSRSPTEVLHKIPGLTLKTDLQPKMRAIDIALKLNGVTKDIATSRFHQECGTKESDDEVTGKRTEVCDGEVKGKHRLSLRRKRRQFRSKQIRSLQQEVARRMRERKYACARCKLRFETIGVLAVHKVVFHSATVSKCKYNALLKERLNAYGCDEGYKKVRTSKREDCTFAQLLKCPHCPFSCGSKARMCRHENKHFVKAEHQCPHCTFSCYSSSVLDQHLRLHKAMCTQMPGRRQDLSKRISSSDSTTSTPTVKMLRCSECPYRSRHVCDMKAHAAMHIGLRSFPCTRCTYSTKRAHVLEAHLQMHAEEDGECSTPPATVMKLSQKVVSIRLKGQVIGERMGNKFVHTYSCRWCPFKTRYCAALFSHNRNHRDQGGVRCKQCSFNSKIAWKMKDHLRLHPASEPTPRSSSEPRTKIRHTPETGKFVCKECPFSCDGYGKLWHHSQKHKKVSRFACDQCSFSAGSNMCLAEHRLVHSKSASSEVKMEKIVVVKDEEEAPLLAGKGEGSSDNDSATENDEGKDRKKKEDRDQSLTVVLSGTEGEPPLVFNYGGKMALLPRRPSTKSLQNSGNLLRCEECPFTDENRTLFSLHVANHSGRKRPFQCNMCSYSVYSPEALSIHLTLHGSCLSPGSAAQYRRRLDWRPEVIPPNTRAFQCSTCKYRTVSEERFMQHRMEHAQRIQQRLITAIKRAAPNPDPWTKPKARPIERKTDKQFLCNKCSFRCDTPVAYNTHIEHHGKKSWHTCSLCDYSADTASVVHFHEVNHHFDVSVTRLRKNLQLEEEDSE